VQLCFVLSIKLSKMKSKTNLGVIQAACLLLFGGMSGSAWAQPTPGDISRQVEPTRASAVPAAQPIDTSKPQPSAVDPGATTVQVRQWVLEGNTLLTQAQVERLLHNFTNVDISLKQINEAAAWVQRTYEEDGWLARVVLPQQDVTDGVVRMQVLEAKLGAVVLDGQAATRVNPEVVQATVNHPLSQGGALNTRRVNRGLLLADDLSGVSVTGQLKSGQAEGSTDVLVRTLDEPPFMFEAGLDNGNARSVGEWRAIGSVLWMSPLGRGESFSAQGLKAEGVDYVRLGASTPLGSSGLKGNVAISHMDYKVVTKGDDGVVPNIKGSAQTISADVAYPLIRSRAQNLYLTAGLEQRDYDSFVDNLKENDYRVTATSIGVSGNHFDNLGGAGSNAYSLSIVSGRVKKLDPTSGNDEATLGSYNKVRWALSRQQAVAKGVTLFASIQGQHTGSKQLDSSENMSLGGPSGVRAYPVGEASGPQGAVANLELRWAVSSEWLITPFYDHGRVQKRNDDALRDYSLKGAGVSATWTGPDGWVAKATYARRMGSNPNPADNGKDQDGSLRKDRVWVSLNRSF
jgi:hemolysin activation/secretion protein